MIKREIVKRKNCKAAQQAACSSPLLAAALLRSIKSDKMTFIALLYFPQPSFASNCAPFFSFYKISPKRENKKGNRYVVGSNIILRYCWKELFNSFRIFF